MGKRGEAGGLRLSTYQGMRFIKIPEQTFTPDGKPLCRWCIGPIPEKSRRRTFCGPECVHEALVRSSGSYARNAVEERDKGVCSCCGFDTERFRLDASYLIKVSTQGVLAYSRLRVKFGKRFDPLLLNCFANYSGPSRHARMLGRELTASERRLWMIQIRLMKLARARVARLRTEMLARGFKSLTKNLWQADHHIPVELGGGGCGLENLVTLCTECHLKKTREQAAERALRKRQERLKTDT